MPNVLMLAAALAAQDPVALPDSAVIDLAPAANGVAYQLYVHTPPGYAESIRDYPAIYLLDAEYSFPLAVAIADHLTARGQMTPAVLVGVAYPDKTVRGYRANRSRDYTPTHVPDGGYGPEFQAESGGAAAFRDAFADAIIPFVEERYRVVANTRGLVGHSYGGVFAATTLLSRPDLFDRIISVSPSLWYDDGYAFALEAETRGDALGDDTRIYFAVGSFEEQQGVHLMVSEMRRFADALDARDDPRLTVAGADIFDNETHASIFPTALSTGLRKLYPPGE